MKVLSVVAAVVVSALAVIAVFVCPGGGTTASGGPSPIPGGVLASPVEAGPSGSPPGGDSKVTAASADAKKKGRHAADTASGPSRHTDARAVGYFKRRWPGDKAVKRITDIRTAGTYLRIYTDLPESAHNSKSALDLCERGLEYLEQEVGDQSPVVFVQARYGQNGNPILANVLGPADGSCRLTHPAPR